MSNIHKGESVISTNDMRKGIMNNNMKMKNAEYKMDKKNIAYIMKGNKTRHEDIIEHAICILIKNCVMLSFEDD